MRKMRTAVIAVLAILVLLVSGFEGSPVLSEDRAQEQNSPPTSQQAVQENTQEKLQLVNEIQTQAAQAEDSSVQQVASELQAFEDKAQELVDDSPILLQVAEIQIRVEGSPAFQQAMQGNIQMLASNRLLARWVVWASENNVVVLEVPGAEKEAGARPWTNTVIFRSGVQTGAFEAAMLVEEIQHLMDDAGLPTGVTCSIDPWSHERVLKARLLAADLLGVPDPRIYGLIIAQLENAIRADALRAEGLHEPCQDFKSPWPSF